MPCALGSQLTRFFGTKLNGHNPAIKIPIQMARVKKPIVFFVCTGLFKLHPLDLSDSNTAHVAPRSSSL